MALTMTGSLMLKNLLRVRVLAPSSRGPWIVLAILGSIALAGLDTLGVASMLPLMQVLTSQDTTSGIPGEVSRWLGTDDLQALVVSLAGVVAIAFLIKSVVFVAFRWWLLGRTTRLTAEASAELMRRYVLSPYTLHKERSLPEIYRNIGIAVPQAFNQVGLGILTLVADLLTLAALALVLLVVSPLATLVAVLVLATASLLVQRSMKPALMKASEDIASADISGWAALMPGLDGFREARLTSSATSLVDAFLDAKMKVAHGQRRTAILSEVPKYVLEITFIIAIVAMTVVLFSTGTPEEALVTLGVFAAASLRMLPTLNRVTATASSIRAGTVGLDILARVTDEFQAIAPHNESRVSHHEYEGDIDLDGVVYTYPSATNPVLDGLTLRISHGETTALVGASGAGKSTVLDLVLGLITPQAGAVRVGGHLIADDLAAWYESVGVVPQEVYLTNTSLRENIAYGVPRAEIDDRIIADVLSEAQLEAFVRELPEGLDTVLGERGVRLSGGQRQRVGIARALYRRPKFLVLDEATSALDNVTESQITRTIDALRGRMTVLIVAHRLSTVRSASQIIYLANGKVESVGTFAQLRASSPQFEELVQLGQLT
ncbi:ABC transporter ATP-binding protein [Pseudoclavibacter terrae]|uniref:ABC transporter ATP-binding protein n=1 Tax=Pseudoclavibacter terrae TaxID=1530195 RepID=UPI00142EACFB|nr:ABC transporter ATP-binding protein [Pseudoclavibacter terrae]